MGWRKRGWERERIRLVWSMESKNRYWCCNRGIDNFCAISGIIIVQNQLQESEFLHMHITKIEER